MSDTLATCPHCAAVLKRPMYANLVSKTAAIKAGDYVVCGECGECSKLLGDERARPCTPAELANLSDSDAMFLARMQFLVATYQCIRAFMHGTVAAIDKGAKR